MNLKNIVVLAICLVLIALVLTNVNPQQGTAKAPSITQYGDAPKNITDIMAGDGAALTEEVNKQKQQQKKTNLELPILTEDRGSNR